MEDYRFVGVLGLPDTALGAARAVPRPCVSEGTRIGRKTREIGAVCEERRFQPPMRVWPPLHLSLGRTSSAWTSGDFVAHGLVARTLIGLRVHRAAAIRGTCWVEGLAGSLVGRVMPPRLQGGWASADAWLGHGRRAGRQGRGWRSEGG